MDDTGHKRVARAMLRPQDWALLSAVTLTGLLAVAALMVHQSPRPGISRITHPAASSPAHVSEAPAPAAGYLEATSNADVATLFIRAVRNPAGGVQRVDCSPDSPMVSLEPGRYHVRIEGEPHRLIARDRVIEIRSGETVYLGPDQP